MSRSNRRPHPAQRKKRRAAGPRKSIYELPPLELECMKAVWALQDASVREIRAQLAAARRPLAYTTVETIMDRLTCKGAVARRKVGRAHRYTPVYRQEDGRSQAVRAVVEHFFGGSRRALRAYLDGAPGGP
ncbi:MAG: BlaI/MecI/CopY family transcriptional regulator, partial [Terriglobia bacterium]